MDTEQRKNVIENFKQFYAGNGSILFQEPDAMMEPIKKGFIPSYIIAAEKNHTIASGYCF